MNSNYSIEEILEAIKEINLKKFKNSPLVNNKKDIDNSGLSKDTIDIINSAERYLKQN